MKVFGSLQRLIRNIDSFPLTRDASRHFLHSHIKNRVNITKSVQTITLELLVI